MNSHNTVITPEEQAAWHAGLDEGRVQGRANALISAAHDGIDFDPNMNYCGRMTHKTIELVFACWQYRRVERVTVGGNVTGMAAVQSALAKVYDQLPGRYYLDGKDRYAELVLFDEEGNDLQCVDDDLKLEEWLASMLVSARITAITPAGCISDLVGG